MKRNSWTFLYVPTGEGGVRTVNVDKRLGKALAAIGGLLVVGVLVLTVAYALQSHGLRSLEQRDREVLALRHKIGELEDAVQNYETLMAENRQMQEHANLLAGLGPLEDLGLQSFGQGGQEPFEDELPFVDDLSKDRIRELRLQLDRLLREARFQRDGYEEVLRILQEDQELRDSTPSIRPVMGGYLSSRYGRRRDPFTGSPALHRGIDFSAPTGTPVLAPASGRVKRASRRGSLGLLLEIDHGNGLVTRYGHLEEFAVEKGDWVSRGQVVARVGNTGRSTGPHLHYEVVNNGRSENPWLYIIRD